MVKRATLGVRVVCAGFGLGLLAGAIMPAWAERARPPASTHYYSTAAPGVNLPGPGPVELALGDPAPRAEAEERGAPVQPDPMPTPAQAEPMPAPEPDAGALAPRLATAVPAAPPAAAAPRAERPPAIARARPTAPAAPVAAEPDPITEAKRLIGEARRRYAQVRDYTCTFLKRERLDGVLSEYHIMLMKARAQPASIYFKFQQPNKGREAIYVAGRNGGRLLAHDVGIGKVVAGTLALDPRGRRAMEDCRHPITEAGLGHLIETVATRWEAEMKPGETDVRIHAQARVGNRTCTMIESTHPRRGADYLFYKVKVYIDHECGLPIRFEAYQWPRRPGEAAELLEEYTYMNLRFNVGLTERDFDPSNRQYSFGRF